MFELLDKWNREYSAQLQNHESAPINKAEISIDVSVQALRDDDDGGLESLQLLSLCSMLPDGLRPEVFEKLRPHFKDIDCARDALSTYALAELGAENILRVPGIVRDFVLRRYFPQPSHFNALVSIYFDIAERLPVKMDENYADGAATAALEMGNLSSLLLTVVSKPSQQIVDAVVSFTKFAYWQRPNLTVASMLAQYLDPYPQWKARCMQVIGLTQIQLGDHRRGIESLTVAAQLWLELGDRHEWALCKSTASGSHQILGEYNHAEALLSDAREVHVELGDEFEKAQCSKKPGQLMQHKQDYPAAIAHLSTARQTFITLKRTFVAAQCSEALGLVYLEQGDLDTAATELEAARADFIIIGSQHHTAQSSQFLGSICRQRGDTTRASLLLEEAESIHESCGNRLGLAECAYQFGMLHKIQGRQGEAVARFKSARRIFEELQLRQDVEICFERIEELEATYQSTTNVTK